MCCAVSRYLQGVMVDGAGDPELFEVFTAEQARQIMGTSHARSVSDAARRRETNGGSPVYWDNKDPNNPTAVLLFDSLWVLERAADHDGVQANLQPLVVPLCRRRGMTMPACRVRVERAAGGGDGEMASRLQESERVLDGYRREAQSERMARLEAEGRAADAENARLRGELARARVAIVQLTTAVTTLSAADM